MLDLTPYISLTMMIVLATIDEDWNPYISNMYFRVDEEYNFYYKSKASREHSQHIAKNNRVAWSILNSEKYTLSSKDKKWLQFTGTAEMLTGKDAEKIQAELYGKQMNFFEMMQNGHMIYKCVPDKVKIHDESNTELLGKVIEFK